MPLVQCRDVGCPVPVGQHDDRSIGQTDPSAGITLHDLQRDRDISRIERLELVGASALANASGPRLKLI